MDITLRRPKQQVQSTVLPPSRAAEGGEKDHAQHLPNLILFKSYQRWAEHTQVAAAA